MDFGATAGGDGPFPRGFAAAAVRHLDHVGAQPAGQPPVLGVVRASAMLEMSHGKSQAPLSRSSASSPKLKSRLPQQAHAMPIALSTGGICLPRVVTMLVDEPPRRARGAPRPRRRGARCFPRRREEDLGSDTERAARAARPCTRR